MDKRFINFTEELSFLSQEIAFESLAIFSCTFYDSERGTLLTWINPFMNPLFASFMQNNNVLSL